MKSSFLTHLLVFSMILMLAFAISCSDSSNPTGGDGDRPSETLSSYSDAVTAIAPPVFGTTGGSLAKIAAIDSVWEFGDGGEHPLLGKVFGEDEPMSLYKNITSLDQQIETINNVIEAQQDTLAEEHDGETYHGAFTIVELTEAIDIPEQAQAILGSDPIELDWHITYNVVELPTLEMEASFSIDSTEEKVLCYQSQPLGNFDPDYPNGTESNLFYATKDLATDAIHIKCVFFKDYGLEDQSVAIWGYEIQTVGTSDFQYRMSWYSNESTVPEGFMGSIVGGGNKDELFALRYRDYHPVGTLNRDISQLFGPDYADSGSITAEFEDMVDTTLFYEYDDLPTALLENPLGAPEMINPWDRR